MTNIRDIVRMPLVHLYHGLCRQVPTRDFNGLELSVPLRSRVYLRPFTRIPYEVEEWEAVTKFGAPGFNFIDVGANLGIISAYMSQIAGPKGNVLSCEPNPGAYSMLVELLHSNECSNVLPLQALILDSQRNETFKIADLGGLGVQSSVVNCDFEGRSVVLPATTIDVLCSQDFRPNYIKIDAEGAESKIVSGAEKIISACRPIIQIEVHGQYTGKDGVQALFSQMERMNYASVNIATWRAVSVDSFVECTHCHSSDPSTGADMASRLYGQMVFIPKEREDLMRSIHPRKCATCGLS